MNVLVVSKSMRAACAHLGSILGREVKHQNLMEVLKHDPVFSRLVEDAEDRYSKLWPLSATDSEYVDYKWLHTLFNRRLRQILETKRWPNGQWPKAEDLCQIFIKSYPPERWEGKTKRRHLLLRAGIPQELFQAVFDWFDTIALGEKGQ